jgi:hypothetical protein
MQSSRLGSSPDGERASPWKESSVCGLTIEFTGHLHGYYDEVIAAIGDAESILIFGPGEAKGELRKRFERSKLGERIVAVETIDKMTDRQIAAKVREYFPKVELDNGTSSF